jgi:hypothetical protein
LCFFLPETINIPVMEEQFTRRYLRNGRAARHEDDVGVLRAGHVLLTYRATAKSLKAACRRIDPSGGDKPEFGKIDARTRKT